MDELQALVQRLTEAKNKPSLATELQTWLTHGGLDSLKIALVSYLRGLEAFSLEVTYEGKATPYTVTTKNTIANVRQAVAFRENVEPGDLIIMHNNILLTDECAVEGLGTIIATRVPHTLQFQTGGIHPITYDVPVTPCTTVGQIRGYLATVSGVPAPEQKLLAGSVQLNDEDLIYPAWIMAGRPTILRTVRIDHLYTFHTAEQAITLKMPYDHTILNVTLALGPKLGVSAARLMLETKQGRLEPESTIAESDRQGPINIIILPTTPPRKRIPVISHHLPGATALGSVAYEWIPIISEVGNTMNIASTPETTINDLKDIVMSQTGIPLTAQVFTIGEGDTATILKDSTSLYPIWVAARRPFVIVSTAR